MSDSDDSSNSDHPFDVEIVKHERRLQLARYKKRYRNFWDYITKRWDDKMLVLWRMEREWRMYSTGGRCRLHPHLPVVTNAYRVLELNYLYYVPCYHDYIKTNRVLQIKENCFCERKLDHKELISFKRHLLSELKDTSKYVEFFKEVAEINYGREAYAIYEGGMHATTMQNARIEYERGDRYEELLDTLHVTEDTRALRRLEAPDIYTLERMKIAYRGIRQNRHTRSLPQDIWNKHILPLLFRQQTIDNFNERCLVARNLKKVEDALRNFRLGFADHYAEERRQQKLYYDVYKHFMRNLQSKHVMLRLKVKKRLAQINDLLEKFKSLPNGSELVLSSLD